MNSQRGRPATSTRNCDLAKLPNLGKTSILWLNACGIRTQTDLYKSGSIAAFAQIKTRGFKPSLAQLYGLEGAIRGIPWSQINEQDKALLVEQLRQLESDNLP